MNKIVYKPFISRSDLRENPDMIFVFGDNDQRTGFGGQAKEMRGEPNAVGIRVKKSPSMSMGSFYTDEEYENNIKKIIDDLNNLAKISFGKIIVFPSNGIGTGMAKLNVSAPQTFIYLSRALGMMFGIKNGNFVFRKPRVSQPIKRCLCKK